MVKRKDSAMFAGQVDSGHGATLLNLRIEAYGGTSVYKLDVIERGVIECALRSVSGNRTKAAKLLGIGRSTLFDKIRQHSIKVPPRAGAK